MPFILRPGHLLLSILSGLVNEEQQRIIEFQNAQIRILMTLLGRKRLRLTNGQRRLLAIKSEWGLMTQCTH